LFIKFNSWADLLFKVKDNNLIETTRQRAKSFIENKIESESNKWLNALNNW